MLTPKEFASLSAEKCLSLLTPTEIEGQIDNDRCGVNLGSVRGAANADQEFEIQTFMG